MPELAWLTLLLLLPPALLVRGFFSRRPWENGGCGHRKLRQRRLLEHELLQAPLALLWLERLKRLLR